MFTQEVYWESCGIRVFTPKVFERTPTNPQSDIMAKSPINPQIMNCLPPLRFSSLSGLRKYVIIPYTKPTTASDTRSGRTESISMQLAQFKIFASVPNPFAPQPLPLAAVGPAANNNDGMRVPAVVMLNVIIFFIYYADFWISKTVPFMAVANIHDPSNNAAPINVNMSAFFAFVIFSALP